MTSRTKLRTFQITVTRTSKVSDTGGGFVSNQFYASFRNEKEAKRSARSEAQPGDVVTVSPAFWLD